MVYARIIFQVVTGPGKRWRACHYVRELTTERTTWRKQLLKDLRGSCKFSCLYWRIYWYGSHITFVSEAMCMLTKIGRTRCKRFPRRLQSIFLTISIFQVHCLSTWFCIWIFLHISTVVIVSSLFAIVTSTAFLFSRNLPKSCVQFFVCKGIYLEMKP